MAVMPRLEPSARQAIGERLGLTATEARTLAALRGPAEVQDFVNSLMANYDDDELMSVRRALAAHKAQCVEGAFVAACALWLAGEPPWIVLLKADDGENHAIVPFLRDGHWGAISKTNHVWLRWRDPVYQSLRELVMSYFHEYVSDWNVGGPGARKTLRAYSPLFDLSTIDPARWVTAPGDCLEVDRMLHELGHYPLLTDGQAACLREREPLEVQAGQLRQFEPPPRFATATPLSTVRT